MEAYPSLGHASVAIAGSGRGGSIRGLELNMYCEKGFVFFLLGERREWDINVPIGSFLSPLGSLRASMVAVLLDLGCGCGPPHLED